MQAKIRLFILSINGSFTERVFLRLRKVAQVQDRPRDAATVFRRGREERVLHLFQVAPLLICAVLIPKSPSALPFPEMILPSPGCLGFEKEPEMSDRIICFLRPEDTHPDYLPRIETVRILDWIPSRTERLG